MSNGEMAQMIPGEEEGKIRGKTGEKNRGQGRSEAGLREVIHAAARSRFSFTQRIMHLELTISKG